jgi:hypothetical protein
MTHSSLISECAAKERTPARPILELFLCHVSLFAHISDFFSHPDKLFVEVVTGTLLNRLATEPLWHIRNPRGIAMFHQQSERNKDAERSTPFERCTLGKITTRLSAYDQLVGKRKRGSAMKMI